MDTLCKAGGVKELGCRIFRYPFAIHLLEGNCYIRMVLVLLGHEDVKTTMIKTNTPNKGRMEEQISPTGSD